MKKAFASVLLALAASAHADDAQCERHMLATYPFPHRPTAEQAKALQDCDADKLYYGIGVHFDYVRARHCAFAKENHDVLMMLYANGLGSPRNYAVAKMAACRAEAAPAETEARLGRLARMQTGKEGPSPRIDICDDAASSQLVARCAGIRADLADQERAARIESLTTRWTEGEQAALQRVLRQAVEPALKAEVLDALREFEAGKLPAHTPDEAVRAERDLSQVKVAAERQSAWLAYRDAWLALGKLRYPAVPSHAWKTYFTRKRLAMLKETG